MDDYLVVLHFGDASSIKGFQIVLQESFYYLFYACSNSISRASILTTILFGYFEYHGDNLEADMKKWGENKKMQEWWDIHIPMLEPLEKGKRDDGWIYMDEIFHSR